jgi:tetratricopeptide (TPR) repeat protein
MSAGITILTAATLRWPHLRTALEDLLRDSPELAMAGGGSALPALAQLPDIDTGVLEAIESVLPDRHADLDVGHAAITQRLTDDSLAITDDPAERAGLYLELGRRLGNAADRGQAVDATRSAVDILRKLAQADPAAHEPGFARSLHDLSARLFEAGRWEEAVDTANQAEAIYRRLMPSSEYDALLAASLGKVRDGLMRLGRREQALSAGREVAHIYRQLAATNADVYEPEVVTALSVLGDLLSDSAHWEEAFDVTKQAVDVYGRLWQSDALATGAVLLTTMNKLRDQLRTAGKLRYAVRISEWVVTALERLAECDNAIYEAVLARSMNTLGVMMSTMGFPRLALESTEKAVESYRRLARADPQIYRAPLGAALNNLGNHLLALGRLDEALTSGQVVVPCNISLLSLPAPDASSPIMLGVFNTPSNSAGFHLAEQVAGYGANRGPTALRAVKATFASCGYVATPGQPSNLIKFTGTYLATPTEWAVEEDKGILIEVAIDQSGQDALLDKVLTAIKARVNRILTSMH